MPFPHDKSIYLNRIKANTNYFYTSITHHFENIEKTGEDNRLEEITDQEEKGRAENNHRLTCILALNLTE
jgi:hypothetical protein